jgi:signal transduction histidine kinase
MIGGMSLLLMAFSLLLRMIARGLAHQFDASLASVAQVLAASIERDENEVELELQVQRTPAFQNAGQPTYYQLWGSDGTTLARSPLLGARDLPRVAKAVKAPVFTTIYDEDARPQRVMGLTFIAKDGDGNEAADTPLAGRDGFALAVARDASDLYDQLRSLGWLLILASAVMIVLSFLIGAPIVGRGLRPLHRIAAEIAAVKVDDLTTRIGTAHVPAEVTPIKDRLNELLSRLEASFLRERRFNADVAHELRTPLAGIRTTIEVALARERDVTEYRAALGDCLEITAGMQSVVNNLCCCSLAWRPIRSASKGSQSDSPS